MSDRSGPNHPPEVFDDEGRPVVLGGRVGRGGESYVFRAVDGERLVAKIYLRRTDAERAGVAEKERKVRAMLRQRPPEPVEGHTAWAWPEATLYDGNGAFRGFLMPEIAGETMSLGLVYNRSYVAREAPQMTWAFLVTVARNLATCVHVLHDSDVVVGDLNETNVLVDARARVSFVDCDSMQVPDPGGAGYFRCPVGRPFLTPPELQGQRFSALDRGPEHDAFGLAVLIFHLLMGGIHPFEIPPPESGDPAPIEENIRLGRTPYRVDSRWQPLRETVPFSSLPPAIQDLFARAFGRGLTDPGARPAAREWIAALHATTHAIARCGRTAHHAYSSHLRSCPWCVIDDRRARQRRAETSEGGTETSPTPSRTAPINAGPVRRDRAPVRMQEERVAVVGPQLELPRPSRALRLPVWPAALLAALIIGYVGLRVVRANRPVAPPDRPAEGHGDDHADDRLGATDLAFGVTLRGVIDDEDDRDVFRLTLYDETGVRFEVASDAAPGCILEVLDADPEPLQRCDVVRTLPAGRHHFVVAGGPPGSRYSLRILREQDDQE